jgi:hypothetical protein
MCAIMPLRDAESATGPVDVRFGMASKERP